MRYPTLGPKELLFHEMDNVFKGEKTENMEISYQQFAKRG